MRLGQNWVYLFNGQWLWTEENKIFPFYLWSLCNTVTEGLVIQAGAWRVGMIKLQGKAPVIRLKAWISESFGWIGWRFWAPNAGQTGQRWWIREMHLIYMRTMRSALFLVIDSNGGNHSEPTACCYSWSADLCPNSSRKAKMASVYLVQDLWSYLCICDFAKLLE